MADWCTNFWRRSSLLGLRELSDPHAHLYAECAHGSGHGSVTRRKCGHHLTCRDLAEAAERVPDAPPGAAATFYSGCVSGEGHHIGNQQLHTKKEASCRYCSKIYSQV